MDANGDGIGDFTGLMRRLDYLHGLGITAIWLMPFQVSPRRDDGYDVADYYGVDPRYRTLGETRGKALVPRHVSISFGAPKTLAIAVKIGWRAPQD
jgi:hypothetical protein